jgi:hypothetical protein
LLTTPKGFHLSHAPVEGMPRSFFWWTRMLFFQAFLSSATSRQSTFNT